MKNRLTDLRNHLFETLEALKDEKKPMEVDRARAISDVGQTLIETAKLELKLLELTGSVEKPTKFFDEHQPLEGVKLLTASSGSKRDGNAAPAPRLIAERATA
jgi:hypothetical protein